MGLGLLALQLMAVACAVTPGEPVPVEPVPAAVNMVQVSASRTALLVEQTVQVNAIVKDSKGRPLNRPVTWVSASPQVASVDSTGVVTALSTGNVRISATSQGVAGHIDFVVAANLPATVYSVQIAPNILTLNPGEEYPLTITVLDSLGHVLHGRVSTWESLDASIVGVNAVGTVTAVREGLVAVAVTVEGVRAQIMVRVLPSAVARVAMDVDDRHMEVGDDMMLELRVEAVNGEQLYGRTITVISNNSTVVEVTANQHVRAKRVGSAVVRASSEGQSFEMTLTVYAPPAYGLLFTHVSTNGTEIYYRNPNGFAARLNAGDVSRHASPSPDGQRLVFSVAQINPATNNMMYDLFAVDRNGLNVKQLTRMPGIETDPVWSPDGTKIAFSGAASVTGMHDVYVMNADGSNVTNLTVEMPWSHDGSPSWSPDSKMLAFESTTPIGGSSVYTMNSDGTNKQMIINGTGGLVRHPTWSPDGTKIAFSRRFSVANGNSELDIVIVPRTGGTEVRIERPGDQVEVVWSPDGTHFAFGEMQHNVWLLLTMRTDGSTARVRVAGGNPAWITP